MNRRVIKYSPLLVLFCGAIANAAAIRMMHVMVRADVNEVRFDNLVMFAEADANSADVNFAMPEGAFNIEAGGGTDVILNAETGQITKRFDSSEKNFNLAFSYSLRNSDGKCNVNLQMPVDTGIIAVYLVGGHAKLESIFFKPDPLGMEPGKAARLYSAKNINAGQFLSMEIIDLPVQRNEKGFIIAAAFGLVLLIGGGILFVKLFRKGARE